MQAAERAEKCRFLSLVTLTFDLNLQTRKFKQQGTKHVFFLNLAQIHSVVPKILPKQKTQTDGAKNRTFHSSLRVVMMMKLMALSCCCSWCCGIL